MHLDPALLSILRCPQSGQGLHLAPAELIDSLNRAREGAPHLEGGLLREDGELLYPIVDGFPILLIDEAVAVAV